jgi:dedicator of cytokinesis protein 3
VKDQWVDKSLYTTAEAFPTILRRSEIVAAEQIRLSPAQTAMERTFRKTQELAALEKRILDGTESNYTLLADFLKNSVDPSVAGSIALYRQLLPTKAEREFADDGDDDEAEDEPELDPMETALKTALLDHAMVVKRCLNLQPSIWANQHLKSVREDLTRSKLASFR